MKEKNDDVEQMIADQLQKEAEEIQKELEQESQGEPPTTLSADIKVRMKLHVDQEIKQYEENKVYAQLSEEDRRALEIGRELLKKREEQQETKEEPTVIRKKRKWKLYVSLAAVFIMVMAVGVTSIGGPERIVEMFRWKVGDREVTQVSSSKDSAISADEKEEEAYQQIKDKLGIEPVRIVIRPSEMTFKQLEYDKMSQTAEMVYQYNQNSVFYNISLLYAEAAIGLDVEDDEIDKWNVMVQGCTIEIKEYMTVEKSEKKFSAEFEYQGVKYFFISTMDKEEFESIIKNLYFFGK